MAIQTPEPLLILTSDGIVRRTYSDRVVTDPDTIIRNMASGTGILVPDAFRVNGCPVHLYQQGKLTSFAVALSQLVINTTWVQEADGNFSPSFRGPISGRMCVQFAFSLPLELGKAFLVYYAPSNQPYLVFSRQEGLCRPALPNVYDDGRLCLGDTFARDSAALRGRLQLGVYDGLPITDVVQSLVNIFERTPWNSDLTPVGINYAESLSFSANGVYNSTAEGNIVTVSRSIISNQAYNWLGPVVHGTQPKLSLATAPVRVASTVTTGTGASPDAVLCPSVPVPAPASGECLNNTRDDGEEDEE